MRAVVGILILAVVAALFVPTASGASDAPGLEDRSFTVVAVVDTGINPYHDDFRRSDLTRHPATYIEGFPRSAMKLDLSLDQGTYAAAVEADRKKWDRVRSDRLHWIPGTNIIGAIGPFGSARTFLDEDGHGTPVASLAGGSIHSPGSDDVLIVAVRGGLQGLDWAARQPWIDVITNSWGALSAEPHRVAASSRRAVENGKVVCFASGNLYSPLLWWGTQGPSWNVNVGAASAKTRGEHKYTGYPNDVLGLANIPAATHDSMDAERIFGGTSAATPNVCGLMARVLAEVRGVLGDRSEGSEWGLASGRRLDSPALKDGCLDAMELQDAVQATAVPAQASPPDPGDGEAIPALPGAPWVRGGYGIVDRDSIQKAIRVLTGRAPRPDRTMEDSWVDVTDGVRDQIYGPPPRSPGCATTGS